MTTEPITALGSMAAVTAVGIAGYITRSVSRSGLISGLVVGSVFALAGGPVPTLALITFFIVGSALTKLGTKEKIEIGLYSIDNGGRTWRNVVGNLLIPSIALILYQITGGEVFKMAFVASLSGSLSDTVAGEVGVLSRSTPRMVTSMAPVPRGTSGAITPLGIASGFFGSLIIPLEAYTLGFLTLESALISMALSFLCGLIDSVYGATLQRKYICGDEIRDDPSGCEKPLMIGIRWIGNHEVNLLSTATVALLAILVGGPV